MRRAIWSKSSSRELTFWEILIGQRKTNSRAPTAREVKVQEILFERAEELNDGLYKELMDALVLKD
jgi:uncharacterized protein with FMN-binding domain